MARGRAGLDWPSMQILLKKILRFFFPRPEIAVLNELRRRKLEQKSYEFSLPNGKKVKGLVPLEAYHEYKDIFIQGIYDFKASHSKPKILDGGGYVGFSTLYFKSRYPESQITVFECEPKALDLLKTNLTSNGYDDVEIVEAALAAEEGRLRFSQEGGDAGSLFLNEGPSIEVNCVKLDQWLGEEIDFLKLNIEGAEMDVLASCGEKLKNVKEMIIEFHSFAGQDQRLQDLLSTLSKQGFRYMLNHFDYESNRAVKPPFELNEKTTYVLLVYAKRM